MLTVGQIHMIENPHERTMCSRLLVAFCKPFFLNQNMSQRTLNCTSSSINCIVWKCCSSYERVDACRWSTPENSTQTESFQWQKICKVILQTRQERKVLTKEESTVQTSTHTLILFKTKGKQADLLHITRPCTSFLQGFLNHYSKHYRSDSICTMRTQEEQNYDGKHINSSLCGKLLFLCSHKYYRLDDHCANMSV